MLNLRYISCCACLAVSLFCVTAWSAQVGTIVVSVHLADLSPTIAPVLDDTVSDTDPYTGPTPSLSQGTLPVSWTLVTGPPGMTIDSFTGAVTWPVATIVDSPHTITIRATNDAGFDEESWLLTVNPIEPELTSFGGTVRECQTGLPIPGALVVWNSLTTLTDFNGQYSFSDVPCGGDVFPEVINFTTSTTGHKMHEETYFPPCNVNFTTKDVCLIRVGDVNGDGNISPGDAQDVFDFFLGISTPAWPEAGDFCPVGGDGFVTPGDAQGIFNMFLGLPAPCE